MKYKIIGWLLLALLFIPLIITHIIQHGIIGTLRIYGIILIVILSFFFLAFIITVQYKSDNHDKQ
jgi:hypothetical protein